MPDQVKEADTSSWFEDFGPMHDLWIRLERGMQVMLGVAVITMFGFLGESWGGENVPYTNIITAVYRVSWAFAICIMTSPVVLGLGLIARKYSWLSRQARGRIYLLVLLIMLGYCWAILYVSAVDVVESLAAATGVGDSGSSP